MNKDEKILYKVVGDLKGFLSNLVLVGGWVPHIYQRYVWEDRIIEPHYTTDIDFGVGRTGRHHGGTIYEIISANNYGERHAKVGHSYPIVPLAGNVPVEFICDDTADLNSVQKLTGRQIVINQVKNFDMLLTDTRKVDLPNHLKVRIPSEAMYVFHKLLTFPERENEAKMAKDLYYAYYFLRFSPNKEEICSSIRTARKIEERKIINNNFKTYFGTAHSKGVLFVEREFGEDSIVSDLRHHIFETFAKVQFVS